jgi:hypothetical protein
MRTGQLLFFYILKAWWFGDVFGYGNIFRPIQVGTSGDDTVSGVSILGNMVMSIAGGTNGSLFVTNPSKSLDYIVAQYFDDNSLFWSFQDGKAGSSTYTYDVAFDDFENSIAVGSTNGDLYAANSGTGMDIIVASFNYGSGDGQFVQFGSSKDDVAYAVVGDQTSSIYSYVYITGCTSGNLYNSTSGGTDIIVVKLDASTLSVVWGVQIGTSANEYGYDVAISNDGSELYITGVTSGSLFATNSGDNDIFISKYRASDGLLYWGKQYGTSSSDVSNAIALSLDDTVLYISGMTSGDLFNGNAGGSDIVVACVDIMDGSVIWGIQNGTSSDDASHDVTVDSNSDLIVVGSTYGALHAVNLGGSDFFISKFDASGRYLTGFQNGTTEDDVVTGVVVYNSDNVIVIGNTAGSLYGPNQGGVDYFISEISLTKISTSSSSSDKSAPKSIVVGGVIISALFVLSALYSCTKGSAGRNAVPLPDYYPIGTFGNAAMLAELEKLSCSR